MTEGGVAPVCPRARVAQQSDTSASSTQRTDGMVEESREVKRRRGAAEEGERQRRMRRGMKGRERWRGGGERMRECGAQMAEKVGSEGGGGPPGAVGLRTPLLLLTPRCCRAHASDSHPPQWPLTVATVHRTERETRREYNGPYAADETPSSLPSPYPLRYCWERCESSCVPLTRPLCAEAAAEWTLGNGGHRGAVTSCPPLRRLRDGALCPPPLSTPTTY